jgi:hypothetical protein
MEPHFLGAFGFIKSENWHINVYKTYLAIRRCHQNHDMEIIFSEIVISVKLCIKFLQTKGVGFMEPVGF